MQFLLRAFGMRRTGFCGSWGGQNAQTANLAWVHEYFVNVEWNRRVYVQITVLSVFVSVCKCFSAFYMFLLHVEQYYHVFMFLVCLRSFKQHFRYFCSFDRKSQIQSKRYKQANSQIYFDTFRCSSILSGVVRYFVRYFFRYFFRYCRCGCQNCQKHIFLDKSPNNQ